MSNISRRNFMRGVGLGAMGAAFGVKLSFNAVPVYAQQGGTPAPAVYQTTLGDFTVSVVRDAVSSLPVSTLVANAEAEEVNELLAANGFPTGESQPNNVKILVVDTGDEVVVFDTGFGNVLVSSLALLGIQPEDVTTVVLSHWHPDHISGVAVDGAPTFPNARYLMTQVDYDLLQSDSASQGFAGALATLEPIAEQLEFYNDGDEIVPGVQAVASPGHTPGHHAFLIQSGDMAMLNTVDAIIHPIISTQRPDWYFGFDADPDLAVETRRSLLSRIADENILMFGYHFPFPGIGVVAAVEGEENSFRFTPLSY